ncbi:MAG: hypothetical protein GEU98_18835 [Pseudonocardiaceae bacterium]|nr:hypothetical protein [Pseudonocardiaceae bacterium]
MDFKVLGPVRAYADGELVSVGGAKPRALLAALLTQPGKAVPPDRLSDAIWGTDPPATARGLVHTYVSGLRRSLAATEHHQLLIRDGTGYRIEVDGDRVDAVLFERLVERARGQVLEGRPDLARHSYARALALWDGPAFGGLGNGCLQPEAQRLDELRLTALEERISADLASGNDAALVAELRSLVHEYPLREQLWGSLMVALCRQGRRGEALNTFQHADRLLRSELGIEPGDQLRELQQAMLTDDPRLFGTESVLARSMPDGSTAAPSTTPWTTPEGPINQLPAGCGTLFGRAELAEDAVRLLRPAEHGSTPAIAVLSGAPGVGKTVLGIHVAQRLKQAFPDGVLYADLRGYRPGRRSAVDVLPRFLRALGVDSDDLPSDVDELSALFRTLAESRRLLIVLDDVCSADQVRALLPGNPGCSVLVTSRNALAGLAASHGAHRLRLDVLSPEAARELVERGLDDPGHAAEVARLCGYLPLAIRTATARVPSGAGLAEYLTRLAGPQRLAALEIAGDEPTGVRPSIERSYQLLEPAARYVFQSLPLLEGPDFDSTSVAAITDLPDEESRRLLDVLTQEHLIRRRADGRYTMDELIWLYAETVAPNIEPVITVPAQGRTRRGAAVGQPAHPRTRPPRSSRYPQHNIIANARSPDLKSCRRAAG